MLNPKPVVVGIAWVVECVEKRAKVDEERFKIDVDVINVAGGNNKVLPSHFHPISTLITTVFLASPDHASETLDPRLSRSRLRDAYAHILGGRRR